jgi:hypothetical protein
MSATQSSRRPLVLLHIYPASWRARYGDELEQLVSDLRQDGRRRIPIACDLMRGAAAAWLFQRRFVMSGLSERARGALITVLWSWVAFAATAAWFGHDLPHAAQELASVNPGPWRLTILHPIVPGAYWVLLVAGSIGVVATVVAAVPFCFEAIRHATAAGRRGTLALIAVPPVIAFAWLAGLRLLPTGPLRTTDLRVAVIWLLLGVAGVAAATQAVVKVVRATEFSDRTWRVGYVCAAAVAAAMLVGTVATIVWGVVFHDTSPLPGGAGAGSDLTGWLTVIVILAVTTARAVIALASTWRKQAVVQV